MKKVEKCIITVLLVAHIISCIFVASFAAQSPNLSVAVPILGFIVDVVVLYYYFGGYNKPHGNMLRYAFLIFGTILAVQSAVSVFPGYISVCMTLSGIIAVYISGRLNKIEKNKKACYAGMGLIVLWACLLIGTKSYTSSSGVGILIGACAGLVLQWIALYIAYTSRFKEHKEAGLLDAPQES